jgi:hypothetical protein
LPQIAAKRAATLIGLGVERGLDSIGATIAIM